MPEAGCYVPLKQRSLCTPLGLPTKMTIVADDQSPTSHSTEGGPRNPRRDALGQPFIEDLPEVDICMLEDLQKMTPDERLQRHESFLEMVLAFKAAGEKYRATLAQSVRPSQASR